MFQMFMGLDRQSKMLAVRHTVLRIAITMSASVAVSAALMEGFLGRIHPIGILCSILVPLLVAMPMTLVMHAQNQKLLIANRKLHALANTDFLTGILNRRAFTEQIKPHVDAVDRIGTQSGALLLIDVDRFKRLNDQYGHDVGDIVLQRLADSVVPLCDSHDRFGRMGGEEFAIYLPHADILEAEETASDCRIAIAGIALEDLGVKEPISVSIGLALRSECAGFQTLYRTADQRLYQAKSEGRDRVVSRQSLAA